MRVITLKEAMLSKRESIKKGLRVLGLLSVLSFSHFFYTLFT